MMKQKRLFKTLFVLLLVVLGYTNMQAQGTVAGDAAPYAVLSENTNGGLVLTFYCDDQKTARNGMDVGPFENAGGRGWENARTNITTVVFDDSFANCTELTSTAFWFYGCDHLTEIVGISNLKTDNVTNMEWMFRGCSGLTILDVSGFKTENVFDFGLMFMDCSSLTSLDISNFKTDNMLYMNYMFYDCSGLTTLDMSNFKTDKVTAIDHMFYNCSGLTTIYAGNDWTTAAVTSGEDVFAGCTNLVGGKGTAYNPDHVDYTYARIDGGPNSTTPGYFTEKNGQNVLSVANITLPQNSEAPLIVSYQFDAADKYTAYQFELELPEDLEFVMAGGTDVAFVKGDCHDDSHLVEANLVGGVLKVVGLSTTNAPLNGTSGVLLTFTIKPKSAVTVGQSFTGFIKNIEIVPVEGEKKVLAPSSFTVTIDQQASFEPYAVLSDNNSILTFYYDDKKTERNGMSVGPFVDYEMRGWANVASSITKVIFDDAIEDYKFLTSTAYWFGGCSNLTEIVGLDRLKTLNVTNMNQMFSDCSSLTSLDVSNFNTSSVMNMGSMFKDCSSLTSLDVSGFNTDNVTGMDWMFSGCSGLTNLDVSNFKTDNMTNMKNMFYGCSGLTSLDVSNFKTDNVTNMLSMFSGCSGLTTLDVSNFNTANVTHMSSMFESCSGLTSLDVTNFKTDNVTDMATMFSNCSNLTSLDLSNFETDNVTDMFRMFYSCSGLTTIYVSDKWSTASVIEMNGSDVFFECTALVGGAGTHYNPDHTNYTYARIDGGPNSSTPGYFTDKNAPVVTNPEPYAVLSEAPISVSGNNPVVTVADVFVVPGGTASFAVNLKDGKANAYTAMTLYAYFPTTGFTTTGDYTVANVWTKASGVVGDVNSEGLAVIPFASSEPIPESVVNNLVIVDFRVADNVPLGNYSVTLKKTLFEYNLSDKDYADDVTFIIKVVDQATYDEHEESIVPTGSGKYTLTFYYDTEKEQRNGMGVGPFSQPSDRGWANVASSITKVVFDDAFEDYKSLTSTAFWFDECSDLTEIFGLDKLRTLNVTDMNHMFSGCHDLSSLDVSNFKTDNVTNMSYMFNRCSGLTSLDVSNFKTDNVEYMAGMFFDCASLTSLDVSNFSTAKTTDMSGMFAQCSNLTTLDVSNFNTSSLNFMTGMFQNCSGLTSLDLSNFNTSNVTDMRYVFYECSNLATIYVGEGWNTSSVYVGENMFAGCPVLVGGAGTHYNPDRTDHEYARIDGGPNSQTPGYFTFKDAPVVDPNGLVLTGKIDNYWYDETGNPDGFEAIIINVPLPPGEVSIWENNVLNTFIENKLAFTTQNGEPVDNVTGRILFTEKDHWKTFDGGRILVYEDANMQGEVAEIDPEWGMIRILNTDVTFRLLSATDRYVSLPLCVKAYIGDDEMPLTNGSFTVMLTKPLSIESISLVEISFENSEEVSVPLDELIHLQDWRNKQLVRNDSPDLYEYYRVDSPIITGTENGEELNKIIMTDLGSPDGSLHSLSEMAPDLAVSYNPDLNHGMLTFVNNGGQLGSFTIFVPVTINHEWGYLSGQVIIKVHEGDMPADAEPYAVLSDNNTVLTFYYDEHKEERNGMSVGPFTEDYDFNRQRDIVDSGWDEHRESITHVVFDSSFSNCSTITSTAFWFFFCENLTTITGISNLRTDNVTNMEAMFNDCSSLTSLDVSGFNTVNVTDMSGMFRGCSVLTNLDVSHFNTDKVTDMRNMFGDCRALTSLDVSHFNTVNVTDMQGMFGGCQTLVTLDLSTFNTGKVTNMINMFAGCWSLTSLNLSNFNTFAVTNMEQMFYDCLDLQNLDISSFNTSSVINMYNMFASCRTLTTLDISSFDTNNVTDMRQMFIDCAKLKTIYAGNGWSTQSVTMGDGMFNECANLVGGAGTHFDPDHVDYTYARIDGGPDSSTPGYFTRVGDQPWVDPNVGDPEPYAVLSDNNTVLTFYYDDKKAEWNGMDVEFSPVDNVPWRDYREIVTTVVFDNSFANCTSLNSTAYWFFNFKNLTSVQGISNLKTDNVNNMMNMFCGCSKLTELDVSHFNTSNVTNMYCLFRECGFTSFDLSNFNTENVTDMRQMFYGCANLTTLNIRGFNTANVTDMSHMFFSCYRLQNLDVSSFNTSNVTNMSYMFMDCGSLETLDLSGFNTSKVTSMVSMFEVCQNLLNLNLDGFNTANVIDFQNMFERCYNLIDLDISSFSISNESVTNNMFSGCTKLAAIQVGYAEIPAEEYANIGNPNLLVYVNEARLAPEGVQNVVVNGVAKEIVLKDAEGNNNWYCPEPFRAEKISYTREFRQQTQIGISRGWESLVLPFAVQTITHQDKGVIAPFGSDASGLHFWLRRLGHEGLISVQMIEPNAPYIISMPNSEDYPERFNLNGRVTFAAQDAYVERTEQMADESADYMMVPAFQRMAVSEDFYALNVGEERNGRPEGSIFERNYRQVRPFEAYTLHRGDRPAPLFFDLSDLEGSTTDVPDVRWMMDDGNGEWYDLQGRKLGSTFNVQRSTLKKGVYIRNGRKTVVR